MFSKYLQNEWIKSNLKEVGWSAWLREVIEMWLIGGLGYTQDPEDSGAPSVLESGRVYLCSTFHLNSWACFRSLEVG